MTDWENAEWQKSSYSGANNNCVEVAFIGTMAGIRDSKDPEGPVIELSAQGWRGLADAIINGAVDQ